MRNLLNRKNQGFTLIELLVVIAIIGILAAVVLVSLNSARSKSRDARRLADTRQIMTALELYYNDNGGYPVNADFQQPFNGPITKQPDPAAGTAPNLFNTYLAKYPAAPTPLDNTPTCDATNSYYNYTRDAVDTNKYTILVCLGGPSGGFAAGVHTASQAGLN